MRALNDWDYDKSDLVKGLKKINIKSNDTVLVYVSFGFLGRLKNCRTSEETCQTIQDALCKVVGKKGTLLVPTYTYSFCNQEVFDVNKTHSVVGPFTEFFRKHKGVKRSMDPIFSVAGLGPNTKKLFVDLPHTCFGKGSIYDRLVNAGGKICMIGLGLHWATFRHHIEEMVKVPFRYNKEFFGHIKKNNTLTYTSWNYYVRDLTPNSIPNGFPLEEKAKKLGLCKVTKIGRGEIMAINCKDYFDLGYKELSKNPWFTAKGYTKSVF